MIHDDEINNQVNLADKNQKHASPEVLNEEPEPGDIGNSGWREAFRIALDRARRRQKPVESRQELSRDRSKSWFVLAAVTVIVLLIFFGIFSTPEKRTSLLRRNERGQANLGRNRTPGRDATDSGKNVVPMLSADVVRSSESALPGQVTPEDVGRTSRNRYPSTQAPVNVPKTSANTPQDYSLGKVDFSDPWAGQGGTTPPPPPSPSPDQSAPPNPSPDLKKPSLVFVRSLATKPVIPFKVSEEQENTLALRAGTRLVARLEAPISSVMAVPVVAVVEYNYERNGRIVLPAGARVFGRLAEVSPTGYVGIQFSRLELPDGTTAKIEASAMDLNFGPLKGFVSGKKTVARFLVRSLTGLGTVASYLVGPQGSSSAGLISTNALMRERLADNVATAGQDQLNGLAFNQKLVVTVPGNTRFYIVLQKPTSDDTAPHATHSSSTETAGLGGSAPTMEELRQLLQLRREINELYAQTSQTAFQPQHP